MAKSSPLILLVEDELGIRQIIREVLDQAGFRIATAGNYAEGLVSLNTCRPAVLIANALLPDGDGHKLSEVARRLGVPTLLVSGHPEVIVEAEARSVPFLAKPFRIADLVHVMRSLIGESPAPTPGQ